MSETGIILVTGATGGIGSLVIQELITKRANVRALVHDEAKAKGLREAGVEVVIADYMQPETLVPAFDGVDKVLLHTPLSPDLATMVTNCLNAALKDGIPYIVRVSETSPEPVSALRVGKLQALANSELELSGLPFSSLRPTFFMQNMLSSAQSVSSSGMIYMPFKDARVGMIDMRDVVDAAVRLLTSGGHQGETYSLTGPAAISIYDIASDLSKELGKPVTYVNVPMEAARDSMLAMGMSEWTTEVFCEYFANHSRGVSDYTTNDYRKLTGHAPRSFETFAHDFGHYFGKST